MSQLFSGKDSLIIPIYIKNRLERGFAPADC